MEHRVTSASASSARSMERFLGDGRRRFTTARSVVDVENVSLYRDDRPEESEQREHESEHYGHRPPLHTERDQAGSCGEPDKGQPSLGGGGLEAQDPDSAKPAEREQA